jgi:hypothetical protein
MIRQAWDSNPQKPSAAVQDGDRRRARSNAYEKNEKTDIGVKYPEAPLETHHGPFSVITRTFYSETQ